MLENQENDMSTRNKINTLINNIQNKINKRAGYNLNNPTKANIDINTYHAFGTSKIPKKQENLNSQKLKTFKTEFPEKNNYNLNSKFNNYIKDINNDITPNTQFILSNEGNSPINEFYLRNIIKEEFSNLILPYQKDAMCNSNLMESKLNDIEKKFEIIINAQNMGNLNDNAKVISAYLCSNLSNDNLNKNIEKLKMEYDTLFDELQKKMDALSNQITMQKMNNDSNNSTISKKIENIEKKIHENDNKEIKIYVEKNIFDETINNFNEMQEKIIKDNENNIKNLNNQIENNLRNINNQIDNINKSLNQYKYDIENDSNKINGINNNINSLRSDFGKITEDVSQIKYQITPDMINKINSIDINSLKQQISPNDFKNIKNNINTFETNLNSIKTMAENSDRSIYDLKKLLNTIEEKQNISNKNIEKMQPLLNENIIDKIKNIDKKIEELSKNKNNNENNNNKDKNDENKDDKDKENKEEKKEEDQGIFSGGSRRQQRNNKSVNNNLGKNANNNLDENTINIIKQLEKINLNELQKIDFKNILSQINNLNNENKILSDKIEEQNKKISEINEKLKTYNNNNLSSKNNFENNKYNLSKSEIQNDFKSKLYEFNDPYRREPKINDININKINEKEKGKDFLNNDKKDDNIIEDDYDDFDKDLDLSKDKEKNPSSILEDKNKKEKKDDKLVDKNNFNNDIFNKKGSKNEFGSFDKYAETNILDQIMGLGGSRRNNDFDKNNKNGGTFITGSLNSNKNNRNPYDRNPIYDNNKNNNNSKNEEFKIKKEEKIEEKEKEKSKNDEDYKDDFDDDFDVEDL